ncbi:MAG: hypothetical protein R3B84_14645 [Zavarzinella sp.]
MKLLYSNLVVLLLFGGTLSVQAQNENPPEGAVPPISPTKPVKTTKKETAAPKKKEPTFHSVGGFENSLQKARESALVQARVDLIQYMAELESPVDARPTLETVRSLIVIGSEQVSEEKINLNTSAEETLYRITIGIHVDAETIRQLRTKERGAGLLWWIGGIMIATTILAGFFKIDSWTKGVLSKWLIISAIVIAGILTALWFLTGSSTVAIKFPL